MRESNEVDKNLRKVEQDLDIAENSLSHMMDRNMRRGVNAVRQIVKQHNIQGVYGMLGELISVRDEYKTAVENTAGASIFDFVVDRQETADKVIRILQKDRLGRATFMPLNRLRNRPAQIPQASDAFPMMSKIQYDKTYEKAVEHVFGRTIICPNLQVASQYNRTHAVNAITADGDRVHRGGHVSGGYHDPRKSRLDALKLVSQLRSELQTLQGKTATIRRTREQKEQEITQSLGEEKKLDQKRQQVENSFGSNQQELRSKQADLKICEDSLELARASVLQLEDALRDLRDTETAYDTELSSEFRKALAPDEEKRLETLSSSIQEYRREFAKYKEAREELEDRVKTYEERLAANAKRLNELNEESFDAAGDGSSSDTKFAEKNYELSRADQVLQEIIGKLKQVRHTIDMANKKIQELAEEKTHKQEELESISTDFLRDSKQKETWMRKKSEYATYVQRAAREIRDIGILPDNAHEKYMRMDTEKVLITTQIISPGNSNELYRPRSSTARLQRSSRSLPASIRNPLTSTRNSRRTATPSTSAERSSSPRSAPSSNSSRRSTAIKTRLSSALSKVSRSTSRPSSKSLFLRARDGSSSSGGPMGHVRATMTRTATTKTRAPHTASRTTSVWGSASASTVSTTSSSASSSLVAGRRVSCPSLHTDICTPTLLKPLNNDLCPCSLHTPSSQRFYP